MTNSEHMKNKDALDALDRLKEAIAECKDLSEMGNDYHQQGTIDGHRDLASVGITKMERARYKLGVYCLMIFTPEFLHTIEQALSPKTQGGEGLDADIIHRAKVTLEYADVELHSLDHESIYVSDHAGGMTYADLRKILAALQNNAQGVDVDIEALKSEASDNVASRFVTLTKKGIARLAVSYALDHLHQQGHLRAIPEGYALVPIEPTDAMLDAHADAAGTVCEFAGEDEGYFAWTDPSNQVKAYKAMLAAAPQPKGE